MKLLPTSRGVALIITLAFVVIVSVLVVGLTETLRTERSAVRTHLERQRATTIAQQGTDLVMARLRQFTVDPPKGATETDDSLDLRTRHWVSQPGRLLIADPAKPDQPKRIAAEVPLTSGLPSPDLLGDSPDEKNPDYYPANLNEALLLDPDTHLITETKAGQNDLAETSSGGSGSVDSASSLQAVKMPVRWVYVRHDGTLARTSDDKDWEDKPRTDDRTNPIVGRFAFWADDETTKVNYNLAWSRDPKLNTQPPGHPTRVDLRALRGFTDETTNELHQFVTKDQYQNIGRFFNTPFDARYVASPALLASLNFNRFNLTHYNHEPDTTYYGRSRMVLTTQLNNAVLRDRNGSILKDKSGKPLTRPFLDILKTANTDPGYVRSIDGTKLSNVISDLVNRYLKKSDWPMVDGTGHSLQEKYYGSYNGVAREQRLAQLALNIIDYVRSAESENPVVEPIRGKYINNKFVGDFVDTTLRGQEDTFKGLARAPYITEMGVWQSTTPDAAKSNRYRTLAFVEVFLPKDYGLDSIDLLNKWTLYFKEFGDGAYHIATGAGAGVERTVGDHSKGSPVFVWEAMSDSTKNVIRAGEYRTLAYETWRDGRKTTPIVLRSAITMVATPDNPSPARIDVAPLGDPAGVSATVPKPLVYTIQTGPNELAITSMESTDPRVNGLAIDWKLNNSGNTFGAVNNAWLASVGRTPTAAIPRQDVDADGNVSAASLRMPPPSLHPASTVTRGRVRSSGELGVIHTGIEGSSTVGVGGVPWRTLHLQPSIQSLTVVPDWAFMDLFTPPVDVPVKATTLFAPHGTSAGGRVNMNARPEPFTQGTYELLRESPLVAVLYKCRYDSQDPTKMLSLTEAQNIADNIYKRVISPGSKNLPKGKQYGARAPFECYESPGEVAEIAGVADRGEASEELMREIANLITARGNTFAVYTIGQALQQTPAGKLLVTAEQRQHVLLERYVDGNGETHLGTVYFRNLIP